MSDWSRAEIAFVLSCARVLVGRYGFDMAFERCTVGLRLWVGVPYGPRVSLDVDVRSAHFAESAHGRPMCVADATFSLRRRLWTLDRQNEPLVRRAVP